MCLGGVGEFAYNYKASRGHIVANGESPPAIIHHPLPKGLVFRCLLHEMVTRHPSVPLALPSTVSAVVDLFHFANTYSKPEEAVLLFSSERASPCGLLQA